MSMLFPMLAIEVDNLHFKGLLIKTANIDIHAIRVRARNIERLDTTMFAEQMLGNTGVKSVSR